MIRPVSRSFDSWSNNLIWSQCLDWLISSTMICTEASFPIVWSIDWWSTLNEASAMIKSEWTMHWWKAEATIRNFWCASCISFLNKCPWHWCPCWKEGAPVVTLTQNHASTPIVVLEFPCTNLTVLHDTKIQHWGQRFDTYLFFSSAKRFEIMLLEKQKPPPKIWKTFIQKMYVTYKIKKTKNLSLKFWQTSAKGNMWSSRWRRNRIHVQRFWTFLMRSAIVIWSLPDAILLADVPSYNQSNQQISAG